MELKRQSKQNTALIPTSTKEIFIIAGSIFILFLLILIGISLLKKDVVEDTRETESITETEAPILSTAKHGQRMGKSSSSSSMTGDRIIVKIQNKDGNIDEKDVDWDKLYQDAFTVGDTIPIKNNEVYYRFAFQKSITKASDIGGLIFVNTQGPENIAILDKVKDWDSEHITIKTGNIEDTDNDVLGNYKLTIRIGNSGNYFMYSLGNKETTALTDTTAQLVKWNYKKDKSYISDALTNAQFSDKNTDNYQVFTNTVTLSQDGKILSISNNGNMAFYVRENVNSKKFMQNYIK